MSPELRRSMYDPKDKMMAKGCSGYSSKCYQKKCGNTCTECPPNAPQTIREVLCNLVGEQIQVTTPFGPITGTLIAVKKDYIVIVDNTGAQVLVRIDKISLVSPL